MKRSITKIKEQFKRIDEPANYVPILVYIFMMLFIIIVDYFFLSQ